MNQPKGWNEAKVLRIGATLTGWPTVIKEINGKVFSQIVKHEWIYDYIEGNIQEIENLKPTPHNIAKKLGL